MAHKSGSKSLETLDSSSLTKEVDQPQALLVHASFCEATKKPKAKDFPRINLHCFEEGST
jgi:hypothetical protein